MVLAIDTVSEIVGTIKRCSFNSIFNRIIPTFDRYCQRRPDRRPHQTRTWTRTSMGTYHKFDIVNNIISLLRTFKFISEVCILYLLRNIWLLQFDNNN